MPDDTMTDERMRSRIASGEARLLDVIPIWLVEYDGVRWRQRGDRWYPDGTAAPDAADGLAGYLDGPLPRRRPRSEQLEPLRAGERSWFDPVWPDQPGRGPAPARRSRTAQPGTTRPATAPAKTALPDPAQPGTGQPETRSQVSWWGLSTVRWRAVPAALSTALSTGLPALSTAAGSAAAALTPIRARVGSLGRAPWLVVALASVGTLAGLGLVTLLDGGGTQQLAGQRQLATPGPALPAPSGAGSAVPEAGEPAPDPAGGPPQAPAGPAAPGAATGPDQRAQRPEQQQPAGQPAAPPAGPRPSAPPATGPATEPPQGSGPARPPGTPPPVPMTRTGVAVVVGTLSSTVDQAADSGRLSRTGQLLLGLKVQSMRVVLDHPRGLLGGRSGGDELTGLQHSQLVGMTDRVRGDVGWLRRHGQLDPAAFTALSGVTTELDRVLRPAA